jgi:uncharacterized protein YndB with AHSA1/START domain
VSDLRDDIPAVERVIAANDEAVWSVLADGWLYPTWVVGASRMREVDRRWPEVGSRLHHSVGNWPLLIDDRTEVLECEPCRLLRLRAHGWPAGAAEVLIELDQEPTGSSTLVRIREDASHGPATLIPRQVRQLAMVARNREVLRRLAFIVEGTASTVSRAPFS